MPFYWFLSKECKFPINVYIPIFWQILRIFLLGCSKFLSKHQVIGWNCYIFMFLIRINWNFDENSQFLEIKCRNLKKVTRFLKSLGYQVNFGQNMCPTIWDILISFNIFFYFMKRSYLVLTLCHFKVQCLGFPMKIGKLATIFLNCC